MQKPPTLKNLRALGLSPLEARCYQQLAQTPHAVKAGTLAQQLHIRRTSAHRALTSLQDKGFVDSWKLIGTRSYKALPLHSALARHLSSALDARSTLRTFR